MPTTRSWSGATWTRASSSRCWVRDGRVVAGMNVNVWDVTDRIRDIILAGQSADAFELPAPSA